MKFRKGKEKTGSRQKGTKNKVNQELKDSLTLIVEGEIKKLAEQLKKIENPAERVKALASILPYVLPKKQSLEGELTLPDPLPDLSKFSYEEVMNMLDEKPKNQQEN